MVGGHVLDTVDNGADGGGVWVKCIVEDGRVIAFFISHTDKARSISQRDYMRLENGLAYWSPRVACAEHNVGPFRNFVTLTGAPLRERKAKLTT